MPTNQQYGLAPDVAASSPAEPAVPEPSGQLTAALAGDPPAHSFPWECRSTPGRHVRKYAQWNWTCLGASSTTPTSTAEPVEVGHKHGVGLGPHKLPGRSPLRGWSGCPRVSISTQTTQKTAANTISSRTNCRAGTLQSPHPNGCAAPIALCILVKGEFKFRSRPRQPSDALYLRSQCHRGLEKLTRHWASPRRWNPNPPRSPRLRPSTAI